MSKNGAQLSQELKTTSQAFIELLQGLDDEQWAATTREENWSVGTVAHHVAQSFGTTWGMVDLMLADSVPAVSWDDINAMNAAHASEHPNPDKQETIDLAEQSTAQVSAAMAKLDDESLDQTAVIPAFSPEPLSVRSWIEMVIIGHIGMHQPSIEAAINA